MRVKIVFVSTLVFFLLGGLALQLRHPEPEVQPEPTDRIRPAGPSSPCPADGDNAGKGAKMVRLPEDFCIDTTEVTRAQYDAWLDTKPSAASQQGACATNDSFEPSCDSKPNQPVVCIDWCDAYAYCAAVGKRLCGRIGSGDGYEYNAYADPKVSEWYAACTSGGKYEYTYGNTLNTQICRGGDAEDAKEWGLVDVGSLSGCHSPESSYSAVYDLSGNAAEWDNACDGDKPDSGCRIRGGAFQFQGVGLRCAMAKDLHWPRMRRAESISFRCCAD